MVRPAGVFSNRYKVDDIPDQTGKVAIVVGGSRGIGEQVTQALVQKGCHVHILSSTEEHQETAKENAEERSGPSASSQITSHTVDLGDLNAVKSLADSLSTSLDKLDMLYLIAGIGVAPYGLTKSGLGNHFCVNNVSQVLFIDKLYPLLEKTAKSQGGKGDVRVVSESSELHRAAPSDIKCESIEEFGEQNKDMDATKLYGRSKLCNIWLISHFSTLLPSSSPITAISVHPGAVETEQQKGATESYGQILGKTLETAASFLFMTQEQGSESALWAGTSPAVLERKSEVQGRYFNEADGKVGQESSQGQDSALASKFWNLCVKAIKEKTGYEVKLGSSNPTA